MSRHNNERPRVFTCRFSDGSSVSFSVDLEHLSRALDEQVSSIPPPPVKKELMPEYIAWMHTVMSTLAQRLGRVINYCYPSKVPGEDPVFYMYKPDGSYQHIPEG